jgi:protein SCO1/2
MGVRVSALCWTMASLVVCSLVGCQKSVETFKATDVTGAEFGRDFRLTDHSGRARTLTDFRGKVVVLFFGYMHCPDFCPSTLSQLNKAIASLGEDGKRVQVLFVTLDPERDSADLLSRYVTSFNASFLGMGSSSAEVATVAKEFRILYEKIFGATPGQYTLNHSTGTYVFDPSGRLRLYLSYGADTEAIAHDFGLLLKAR